VIVGHFSLTFAELEIPLAGIPIRVTRTYDTRQSKQPLDFGYGWSVDYQNVRVRESRKLGFSWTLQQTGGGLAPWCIRPNGIPQVTVTLPDGEVEKFRARFEPECTSIAPEVNGHLVFESIDGTDSKLEQLTYGLIRFANLQGGASNLIDPDLPGSPLDPSQYRLTTEEGLIYDIDQSFGIRKITEPNGQFLIYSSVGIVHSTGVKGSLKNLLRKPMAALLRARNPHGLTVRCGSCARCALPSARSLRFFKLP